MPLTDAEYEDLYVETVRCLTEEHEVGEAFRRKGVRYCLVDRQKLSDRDVFNAWWDAEIAREILKDR